MDLPPIDPVHHDDQEPDVESGLDLATILILVLAIGLATTGQLLLKAGMGEIGEISSIGGDELVSLVGRVVTTWQTVVGLACFGASSLFWLVVLSRLPLSTAYPFVAMSYLVILGFSVLVLHERPPLLTWAGASLIMCGIVLVGFGGFERGS